VVDLPTQRERNTLISTSRLATVACIDSSAIPYPSAIACDSSMPTPSLVLYIRR
jgi:hypothetical protein